MFSEKNCLMLITFLVFIMASVGVVSASNVYTTTNESYDNYFDEEGYVNNSNIGGGNGYS